MVRLSAFSRDTKGKHEDRLDPRLRGRYGAWVVRGEEGRTERRARPINLLLSPFTAVTAKKDRETNGSLLRLIATPRVTPPHATLVLLAAFFIEVGEGLRSD